MKEILHGAIITAGLMLSLSLNSVYWVLGAGVLAFGIFLIANADAFAQVGRFGGVPNMITTGRLFILILSAIFYPAIGRMLFGAIIILILVADGFDGYAARKFEQQSEIGALFDLEVDAFLAVVLTTVLLLNFDLSLAVVAGAMIRYVFVAVKNLSKWSKLGAVHVPLAKTLAVTYFSGLVAPFFLPLDYAQWLVYLAVLIVLFSFGLESFLYVKKRAVN